VSTAAAMLEVSCGSMMSAIIYYLLWIYYLLFSACSSSMREATCGSMMPATLIYLLYIIHLSFIHYILFVYSVVPAAAACVRYPATTRCQPFSFYLFIIKLLLFIIQCLQW
jgi:hypothetical protein